MHKQLSIYRADNRYNYPLLYASIIKTAYKDRLYKHLLSNQILVSTDVCISDIYLEYTT